jgi:uncharacterized phage-like protein YoqJ
MEKSCSIIGRKNTITGNGEHLKQRIFTEVSRAVNDGYTKFIIEYVSEVNLCFFEIITELKKAHPNIKLETALSSIIRKNKNYDEILKYCDYTEEHTNMFNTNHQ